MESVFIYEKIHETQDDGKRDGVSGRRDDNVGWNEDVLETNWWMKTPNSEK